MHYFINIVKLLFFQNVFSVDIQNWNKEGRVFLKQDKIADGEFLKDYNQLILLMAATNDKILNRKLVQAAKQLRCYAYAVDDPEVSDFNHPSVLNIRETVQVAISTGGKSPLMAKQIRKKIEPVMNDLISQEDVFKIQLQFRLREKLKTFLQTADTRKAFLENILVNAEINELLVDEKLDEAENLAMEWLKKEKS